MTTMLFCPTCRAWLESFLGRGVHAPKCPRTAEGEAAFTGRSEGPAPEAETYEAVIARKDAITAPVGMVDIPELSTKLFPFQRELVAWALGRGRAALFADTGLGKTGMSLEWARHVAAFTGRPVIILAPLAVSGQTVREGASKFDVDVTYVKDGSQVPAGPCVVITNYERVHLFDLSVFGGVVLDESGILKSFMGPTKRALVAGFAKTPFRLACTATPAPNDHMELGNHSEFLGILDASEMITRWFINDTSLFGNYRLKGHAVEAFWDWVCTWARCVGKPSDLGGQYADDGYVLPALNEHRHVIDVDILASRGDGLFRLPDLSATSVHKEKRLTAGARAARIGELVAAEPEEQWLVWCDTDYEADALREHLPDAVEVRGSQSLELKEERLLAFAGGTVRVLITKPSLAGWGLNFQGCARVAFVGASFSYEQRYQAIRRCWRFGQQRPVEVHVAMSTTEVDVWSVLLAKRDGHDVMKNAMFEAMQRTRSRGDATRGRYLAKCTGRLPEWLKEAS